MSKVSLPPISPTVANIFSDFLNKLQTEKICDDPTIERLRAAIEEQKLDSENLRAALFDALPKKP